MNDKGREELPQPLKDLGSSFSTIKKDKSRYKGFFEEIKVDLSPKNPSKPFSYYLIQFVLTKLSLNKIVNTNRIYKKEPEFRNTNCIYKGVNKRNFVLRNVLTITITNKGVSS